MERAGTWLYASPEETTERLERAGFSDVHAWSHPELATFQSDASLIEFLGTVCLREHLRHDPCRERRPFAEHVAAAMPSTVIDYVRLNIVARLVCPMSRLSESVKAASEVLARAEPFSGRRRARTARADLRPPQHRSLRSLAAAEQAALIAERCEQLQPSQEALAKAFG